MKYRITEEGKEYLDKEVKQGWPTSEETYKDLRILTPLQSSPRSETILRKQYRKSIFGDEVADEDEFRDVMRRLFEEGYIEWTEDEDDGLEGDQIYDRKWHKR